MKTKHTKQLMAGTQEMVSDMVMLLHSDDLNEVIRQIRVELKRRKSL